MENDPDDDAYDYNFSITSGRLPAGLVFDEDGRRVDITGTPTEAGTFQFEVEVEASSQEFPEPECLLLLPESQELEIIVTGQ